MRLSLSLLLFGALGFFAGAYTRTAAAAEDLSCCIYQGPHGYFCVNWYSGNEVDCMSCPRGPQICTPLPD